ncbi:MAG: pilus assembly PilX N-terminal domain-containing protein [Desulfobulbaceae bacterium]|nr:pilus assembly PilX N-terminal domain-containing protein [Desulfobulbaceae bacterium]
MPSPIEIKKNEQGFVLVTALLIMLVLTVIGIAGSINTSTELLIAGNDRTFKETFFNADGGAEVGQELLEQNLACITGFPEKNNFAQAALNGGSLIENFIYVKSPDFWRNFSPTDIPSDFNDDDTYGIQNRDIFFPLDSYNKTDPHTNLNIAGSTKLTTGSAIQMAAGYEGKGYALGAGGAYLIYDILSQHLGKNNSESIIHVFYRHIIGNEGSCYY